MITLTLVKSTRQLSVSEWIDAVAFELDRPREVVACWAYEEAKAMIDGRPRLAKARIEVGQILDAVG